jgi:hypothetical protein
LKNLVYSWDGSGELTRSGYRFGYRNAGDLLANQILATDDLPAYGLIYPMVNLYRHFVEISIKDYIDLALFVGSAGLGWDIEAYRPVRNRLGHDLDKAYSLFCELHLGQSGPEYLDWVQTHCGDLIKWLHGVDAKGEAFRYAVDRKSQAQFPASFTVDVTVLRGEIKGFDLFMWQEYDDLRQKLDPCASSEEMSGRIYQW